jgi:hypothetical protein
MNDKAGFYRRHREYINFFSGILLLACIFILGPMFSTWYGKNREEKIKKNGIEINGVVTGFGNSKGSYVEIGYAYKKDWYTFTTQDYPGDLGQGNIVIVLVDSTDPHEAYLMKY